MDFKSFLREYVVLIFAPHRAFVVLISSCILAIAGPFGTYSTLGIFERLSLWGMIVLVAVLFVTLVKLVVATVLPSLGYWQNGLVVSAGFAVFYTPVLVVVTEHMTAGVHLHLMPVWMQFIVVFAVSLAIIQLRYLRVPPVRAERPKLFDRFEDRLTTKIYRVTVRDHYVDVFTNRGVETLLMRFSDAIAELDGLRGEKVHRSHWVACDAMVGLDRSNGRYLLELMDGSKVPVSRSYRPKVEDRLANGPALESLSALGR